MSTYLIFGMTYAFACAVQPGPFLAHPDRASLAHGWRRTLPAAFAPLLSDGPVILLTLLVLTHIRALLDNLFCAWLAAAFCSTWPLPPGAPGAPDDPEKPHRDVIGTPGPAEGRHSESAEPRTRFGRQSRHGAAAVEGLASATPAHGIALLAGFYGVMVLSLMGIIILFATARRLALQVNRVLVGLSALALVVFGCYQLWTGLHALL